jgi:hypothetical protein
MRSREDKNEIVNGGMRDAWLGAGLEVPVAEFDVGNAARRRANPDQSVKQAAAAKRERRLQRNRERNAR